ncbi:hypothetical protein BGX28_003785 [Mortierella sp. GBA30]|nr:hypothetical protein BGX28_003785 [Mortierella sp. GBA30]
MASLLSDLPSNSATDVDALFRVHYERRGPIAKAAVSSSQHLDQLLFNRKLTGKLIRKMSTNWMSEWLSVKMVDRMFESRPILPFLQPVIERGSYKNKDPVPLLKDKRFAVARRKSLSSGYLTKGKKGSLRTKKEEDELQRDYMDLRIDSEMFSSSMPSILLPGSTTMTRPMPSMMDVEGTLIPMQSRPMDKEPLERDGHWHYYQGS